MTRTEQHPADQPTPDKPKELTPEEQAAIALAASDSALFAALVERSLDEQRRRAALTIAEQPLFDARSLALHDRLGVLAIDEKRRILGLKPEAQAAYFAELYSLEPTQQHVDEDFMAELTWLYVSKIPLTDKVFNECVARFKALNAPPPEGGVTARESRTERAAREQAIRDEQEAEKRARGRNAA